MYDSNEFSNSKIIAIAIFIFTVISALIAVKYGFSILDSLQYLLSDATKAAEIANNGLKGAIIWIIISTISGLIAKIAWNF